MNFLEEVAALPLPARRMRRFADTVGGAWDELPCGALRQRLPAGSNDRLPKPRPLWEVDRQVGPLREMSAQECDATPGRFAGGREWCRRRGHAMVGGNVMLVRANGRMYRKCRACNDMSRATARLRRAS